MYTYRTKKHFFYTDTKLIALAEYTVCCTYPCLAAHSDVGSARQDEQSISARHSLRPENKFVEDVVFNSKLSLDAKAATLFGCCLSLLKSEYLRKNKSFFSFDNAPLVAIIIDFASIQPFNPCTCLSCIVFHPPKRFELLPIIFIIVITGSFYASILAEWTFTATSRRCLFYAF